MARLVPAAEQRQAVQYLRGEEAASLEGYAEPSIVERVNVYGGYRAIDRLRASLVTDLLTGPNVALLESQSRRDPAAYPSLDLGRDTTTAIWQDLRSAPRRGARCSAATSRPARRIIDAWRKGRAGEASQARALQAALSMSEAAARAQVESGDDTVFVAWLRGSLPDLKTRLEAASRAAASESDRLHFAEMAAQVTRLVRLGQP